MHNEVRLAAEDSSGDDRFRADVLAFVAVLATGMTLILGAHVGPDALGAYLLAFAALFSAWRR